MRETIYSIPEDFDAFKKGLKHIAFPAGTGGYIMPEAKTFVEFVGDYKLRIRTCWAGQVEEELVKLLDDVNAKHETGCFGMRNCDFGIRF